MHNICMPIVMVTFAESSDDSYVSAEEDPLEAPIFEFPLQDTIASSGAEVLLKCIIAGNPLPEGKFFLLTFWREPKKKQLECMT